MELHNMINDTIYICKQQGSHGFQNIVLFMKPFNFNTAYHISPFALP